MRKLIPEVLHVEELLQRQHHFPQAKHTDFLWQEKRSGK